MAIENIDDKDCKQKVSVLIAEFNELERDQNALPEFHVAIKLLA